MRHNKYNSQFSDLETDFRDRLAKLDQSGLERDIAQALLNNPREYLEHNRKAYISKFEELDKTISSIKEFTLVDLYSTYIKRAAKSLNILKEESKKKFEEDLDLADIVDSLSALNIISQALNVSLIKYQIIKKKESEKKE